MFIVTEAVEEVILEFTDAPDIFVLPQSGVPIDFLRLVAAALCREPVRIKRWKAALQQTQNQCTFFQPTEATTAAVHRNRSIWRKSIKMQFIVARAIPRIGRERQAVGRSGRRSLLLLARQ